MTPRTRTTASAGKRAAPKAERQPASQKKLKTCRLSESKVAAVQAILGVETATAAIETALDMVVFRKELVEGTAAMRGIVLASYEESAEVARQA
jgi:hypothetical protein